MSNFIFHMEHSHVLCMIIQCCISTKEIPIECVKLILIELNLLLLFFLGEIFLFTKEFKCFFYLQLQFKKKRMC